MLDSKYIGSIVRFHRKKSGLSQQELAQLSGLGKTVIFDVEKGKATIRIDTLLKILSVLNIQIIFHSPLMNLFEEEHGQES